MTLPARPESEVVTVLRQWREAMDAKDAGAMQALTAQWLQVEKRLDADIAALAYRMAELQAQGKPITEQLIWREARFKYLRDQMETQITSFNTAAASSIATSQAEFGTLGIQSANEAIAASFASLTPTGPYWNRLNIGAVETMIGFAGDGSPLSRLLKNDYPDAMDGLLKALINGMARGLGPAEVARMMSEGMGMGLERALLIARTEQARAYRMASTAQYRASGVVTGFYRLVKKVTACMACLMLDGEVFKLADELNDHPCGKAELPGNLILSSMPSAFVTLRHDGDIIIIRAASRKLLTVTPNHPVLTDRGWIAAKLIKEGDNIVSDPRGDWASGIVRPDKNHVPALVEKIPSTFNMVSLGPVPETAKHLYSDGEDGDVDVIFTDRLLWNSLDAASRKEIEQYLLPGANVAELDLSPFGLLTEDLIRNLPTAGELLSVGNGGFPFNGRHSGESQRTSLGTSAPINPVLSQNACDDIARNLESLRNGLLRFPGGISPNDNIGRQGDFVGRVKGQFDRFNLSSFGFVPEQPMSLEMIREGLLGSMPFPRGMLGAIAREVVFDRVTQVDVGYFFGHVYSLQTQEGWYSSNGIISHNCIAVPSVIGVGRPRWQTGPQWFLTLAPEQQAARMGPERYQLWQTGQVTLADIAGISHSAVWGDSPRVKTLAELRGE